MHKLYILFYILQFCAIYIRAIPVPNKDLKLFDIIKTNFAKSCPVLNSNVLTDSSIEYLSTCKDVLLTNPPEKIDFEHVNEYYCVAILAADIQLCKAVSNSTYKFLPKDNNELKKDIEILMTTKSADICSEFKNLTLFNDSATNSSLSKWMSFINSHLRGSFCTHVCSQYDSDNVNNLCSMLYYINDHIANITNAIAQPQITQQAVTQLKTVKPTIQKPAAESTKQQILKPSQQKNIPPEKAEVKTTTIVDKTTKQLTTPKPISTNNPETTIDNSTTILSANSTPVNGKNNKTSSVLVPPMQQIEIVSTTEKNNKVPKEPKVPKTSGVQKPKPETSATASDPPLKNIPDNSVGQEYDDEPEDKKDEEDDVYVLPDTNLMGDRKEVSAQGKMPSSREKEPFDEGEDSNFFTYFMFISLMFIAGYVVYHNKQKIMALVLEGRRDRNARRRPNTASYRKLNSNLEEAVTSKCSGSASHVIY